MTFDRGAFREAFRQEADEYLARLGAGVLDLEGRPHDRALVDDLFRAAHNLKGAARLMRFDRLGAAAHDLEDELAALRRGAGSVDAARVDQLLAAIDRLGVLLAEEVAPHPLPPPPRGGEGPVEGDGAGPNPRSPFPRREGGTMAEDNAGFEHDPSPKSPLPLGEGQGEGGLRTAARLDAGHSALPLAIVPSPVATGEGQGEGVPFLRPYEDYAVQTSPDPRPPLPSNNATVRIGVERLDALVNLAGELLPLLQRARAHAGELHGLAREATALRRVAGGRAAGEPDRVERGVEILAESLDRLAREYAGLARAASDNLATLRDEVLQVRLTPIATAFVPLARAARDLARRLGKEARLELEGSEVELDHRVVEVLAHPLIHLVQNAVDHGLEPPDERVARGKPIEGRIRVLAQGRGNRVVVSVADDGRGLNPAALRAAAIDRGLLPANQAHTLSDEDALQLVLRPGFSTAARITETSGRGVGMDAVRASVERLGGRIRVLNAPGRGATFELDLPLSLAITRVLLVRTGPHELAIPVAALEQVVEVRPGDVYREDGQLVARLGGRARRLLPLVQLWGSDDVTLEGQLVRRVLAVVLATGTRREALLVDRVEEECDVVVRPLGTLLSPLTMLQGGAVLADGRVVLVLDPTDPGEWWPKVSPRRSLEASPPDRLRALVVEDVPTSREIVRRVLAGAGFAVDVAPDGLTALDLLARFPYDAVVTDLELPDLGGLELIARLRADPRLATLPVVVLSTHASAEDRQAAAEIGANAYLTKDAFDQDELIATLCGLVGRRPGH